MPGQPSPSGPAGATSTRATGRPGEPGSLVVVDHPLVADALVRLRDRRTDSATFRRLTAEIARFLAYEALGGLETAPVAVATPVAEAPGRRVSETPVVVPVLRAGLGMAPAVTAALPSAELAGVGARRDEATLGATVYLDGLPSSLAGRRVVVCDPMLATGGTLVQVCDLVVARGARSVVVLCLVASAPGLARLRSAHPSAVVACAAVDPALDPSGYILPGLGDAGDRLFGPP